MDKLASVLAELAARLGDLTQQHGPEAVAMMVQLLQARAIGRIAVGFVLLALTLIPIKVLRFAIAWRDENGERPEFSYVMGVLMAVLIAVLLVGFIGTALSASNWMTAFDGRYGLVWIALDAVQK
jgi:small-conductance mechanosensitive channel